MNKTLEFIIDHLSPVTEHDAQRFSATADIQDVGGFVAQLQAFVRERVEAVKLPAALKGAEVEQSLARRAAALRSGMRWVPGDTHIQRGRATQLASFDQPHNLPLPEFAHLANKVRQQIYKDIDARRLLALNVGPRGRKLPDWQLDPVKHRLTQAVLQGAPEVETWTLYRALSEPLEGLNGLSPVEAVTEDSIDEIAKAVFNVLSVH